MTTVVRDELEEHDLIYLEKLRLATDVILQVGEDPGALPDTFLVELYLFKDRVERALLLTPGATAQVLPWRKPAPGGDPRAITPRVPHPHQPALSHKTKTFPAQTAILDV